MLAVVNNQKESISSFFDRASRRGYGNLAYFPHFGRQLVEVSGIQPGESVLDVACGRGAILFPVAERVGERGKALGIDLSKGMVQDTNADILMRGLKNVIALQMDSENLLLPEASCDAVLCGFALFFFSDLPRALAEFRRVLKPGGRLTVSTWGADDPNWDWYETQRLAYGITLKLTTQSLDDPNELRNVLSVAGFANVETHIEEYDWVVPDEETWWQAIWSISTGAALEKFEPHVAKKFKQEAFETMRPMKQADGYHRRLQANFATGIKPY